MSFVLDSSAVLALIREEAGAERVASAIPLSAISAVNATEVVTRLIDLRHTPEMADAILTSLSIEIVPYEEADARLAGGLRDRTRHLGLSLGDRACLATAIRLGATVLTADRAWTGLDVGCAIEIIR